MRDLRLFPTATSASTATPQVQRPAPLYVLARTDGETTTGITSAEFRIEVTNTSGWLALAIVARGGTIRNCTFVGNEVSVDAFGNGNGGAIWCFEVDVQISHCIFLQNRVTSIGYPGKGGAISSSGGVQPAITNCTFLGNVAKFFSPAGPGTPVGGLYLPHGGTVSTSIIAWSDGAPCEGPVTMSCTVLYENSLGNAFCGIDGGGNVVADPLFCASDPMVARDVTLRSNSPGAPGQVPGCGLIGAGTVACPGLPVQQGTWSKMKGVFRGR